AGSSLAGAARGEVAMALSETLRQTRRRIVKRAGKRIMKASAALIARQSLVADRPLHDPGDYPFIAPLEANWQKIRAELDMLLAQRARLPAFHEISPDQKYISLGDDWKVFILFGFGVAIERNCARCPETARLLRGVPGLQSALFSILAPHYHIPKHRGVTKSLLRAHLGLVIPAQRANCRMRVGDQKIGRASCRARG